ncbi:PPA1309 family protein [Paenibacillus sp. TRM 82003]|uniref:PPA1309 family protein n=1 Tax=Kineococcus sp. TRM81007 TaxID=2925831 RepID=UPI001F56DDE6|nr:PPA1309 family protein [Kineococcus sp. TRM81007]MCI2239215.1 PPA1309 family protein [Kineococcus sp. TRM81007]MCI3924894.1 PPA1309 family protein [Paenibacillus sp. TRM 82003]
MNEPVPPTTAPAPASSSLWRTVAEIERYVATDGWGAPLRLFALVRTADALERDPQLAQRLPENVVAEARADTGHLTSVEQDGLPDVTDLDELLGQLAWPHGVDGAALVVERILVPPDAETEVRAATPADDEARATALAAHPLAEDVRIAVGVLRDGSHECAVRSRSKDSDGEVATGADLVPGLVSALQATLQE